MTNGGAFPDGLCWGCIDVVGNRTARMSRRHGLSHVGRGGDPLARCRTRSAGRYADVIVGNGATPRRSPR